MTNFSVENPPILQKFLNRFTDVFTKPAFISFSFYVSGLFLQLKRTNIQSITLNSFYVNYENMQYFLSEAKWNPEELNNCRLQILQNNRTTKSSTKGVLVIDDSGCKKWGYKTEGAQIQHYGAEDRETRCNVVVASAYCDSVKRYPVNHRPYKPGKEFFFGKEDPDFKSKIDLAAELVEDALAKKLKFSDVLFDEWYFANHFVEHIHQDLHLTWISEAATNRVISYRGKWIHADELVKLIPADKFRPVTVSASCGKEKTFWLKSFRTMLKGIPFPLLVVVAKGSWSEDDKKGSHIFVTNHLSLSAEEVVARYALRWGIECIFRDLKENVAFDHYQVRSLKSISRHWHLTSLAYTFLLVSKLNGSFSKIFNQQPITVGEQLLLFRKINSLITANWIKMNYDSYQNYLGLRKSRRHAA